MSALSTGIRARGVLHLPAGKKLEGDLRRAARAEFIRQRLNGN